MSTSKWTIIVVEPDSECDHYASCGRFSYCDATEAVPNCKCFDGFEPKGTSISAGCVRKEPLKCGEKDHFVTLKDINRVCQEQKLRQLRGGVPQQLFEHGVRLRHLDHPRCLLWFGELLDMKYPQICGEW